MRSRARNTRGLSTYSSVTSSRSSISTPRSSRPGVISAVYSSKTRRPGDGHRDEGGISGLLRPLKRRTAVGDRLGDLGTDQAIEGSIGKNPRRLPVVGVRLGQRSVQERDRRRLMGSMCARAREGHRPAPPLTESPGGAPRANPPPVLFPRRDGIGLRSESVADVPGPGRPASTGRPARRALPQRRSRHVLPPARPRRRAGTRRRHPAPRPTAPYAAPAPRDR